MADKDKKPTPEEREATRKVQYAILESGARDFYTAGYAFDNTSEFGEEGKSATYNHKYIKRLEQQVNGDKIDEGVARIQAYSSYISEIEAQKLGKKPGEASHTSADVLRRAIPFYQSALSKVKVSDIFKLMGIKKYENVKDKLDTYVEDLEEGSKEDKQLAQALKGTYIDYIVKQGVGESLILSGEDAKKNLERLVNEKDEEKKK